MSVVGLGDKAVVGELIAEGVDVPYVAGPVGGLKTFADNGSTVEPKGFYICDTTGGATALTLGAGRASGDIVDFYLHASGGNALTVNATLHVIGAKAITFSSGAHLKLLWYSSSWNIIGRSATQIAAADAVAGLPVIPA